jgi:hypothetical protein
MYFDSVEAIQNSFGLHAEKVMVDLLAISARWLLFK